MSDLEPNQTFAAAVGPGRGRRACAASRRRRAGDRAFAKPTSDDSPRRACIEIGLEFASPRREATDLPPGPDTDASVASPALAEQKAELKETELPKDIPTEADDPDRVVTPNDSTSPRKKIPKIAAVQTQASTELVAAEATATPSSKRSRKGPRSIAPAIGIGESARRRALTWQKELVAHLEKHKRYPVDASKGRRDSGQLCAGPDGSRRSRPASSRDPVTRRSTKRRSRWCGTPTRSATATARCR